MKNTACFALATLFAACGSTASPPAPDGAQPDAVLPASDVAITPEAATMPDLSTTLADAAPSEAGPTPAPEAGADAVRPSRVRFTLRNETGKAIYLQGGAYWTLLRGDQPLRPEDTCEYCNCEGTGCAVCGKPLDFVVPLEPGAMQSWDWAGLTYVLRQGIKPIECEEAQAVAPGPLTVRVAYSFSRMDNPPESVIGPRVTVEQTFELPPTGDVVLVAR